MAKSRDEIFAEVQEVLVDALGLDDDEVTPGATLMGDLAQRALIFWILFSGLRSLLGSRFLVKNCSRQRTF